MMEIKANMKGSNKMDLICVGCKKKDVEENQTHVMNCVAYEDLRKDLDFNKDKDLVVYFQNVMNRREKISQSDKKKQK